MRKVAMCVFFLLIFTAFIFADSVSMQINSMGRMSQNRVYVGASQLTIRGGSKTPLWSDDYVGSIPTNHKWWDANATLLSSGNLTNTKWRNEIKYRQAGWLMENKDSLISKEHFTLAQIHFALWNIFASRATPDRVQGINVQILVNRAAANYGSFKEDLLIYSPKTRSSKKVKEFITIVKRHPTPIIVGPVPGPITVDPDPIPGPSTINPVPEPSTLMLLGSGMIGLASYARKKIRKDC